MRAREFDNSKLVIFDIDDTLVNTDTKVGVVKDGRTIKQLDSHDFTHYKLQPGEEFDFGAFRDAREFFANARPIAPMIRQLKQDIATGNRVIMVTARADFNDRDIFLDTFRKWGIDMSKVHVYRAGNIEMKVATEEKKKIILRHLLGKTHYDKVIMYDDAVPNLDAFLSLAQDYPWSRFYAWHVDREGGATEYHRSGAGLRENTIEDDRIPQEIYDLIDELNADDTGSEDFGDYVLRFEGFTDWCQQDAAERCDLPDNDPRKLKYYEDVYDEVLRGWVQEQGSQPVDKGFASDEDYPVQWAVFKKQDVVENFADGKKPGRKGLAKRMGVNCKQSVTKLRKIAKNSSGERARMAHWCANMKAGKKNK